MIFSTAGEEVAVMNFIPSYKDHKLNILILEGDALNQLDSEYVCNWVYWEHGFCVWTLVNWEHGDKWSVNADLPPRDNGLGNKSDEGFEIVTIGSV